MLHSIENKYVGELRTESTHLKSSNVIITDAPTDNNGKGNAFSPTDLVASALCSCMTTVMGICANKNQSKFDVNVDVIFDMIFDRFLIDFWRLFGSKFDHF